MFQGESGLRSAGLVKEMDAEAGLVRQEMERR
jgi:hypothetical protein